MAVASTIKPKAKKSKVKALDVYKWQGLNRKGKKVSGELNAANMLELKAQLRKQGITPGRISKKAKPLFGMGGDKKILPVDAKDKKNMIYRQVYIDIYYLLKYFF